jgi:hypothetical protein
MHVKHTWVLGPPPPNHILPHENGLMLLVNASSQNYLNIPFHRQYCPASPPHPPGFKCALQYLALDYFALHYTCTLVPLPCIVGTARQYSDENVLILYYPQL